MIICVAKNYKNKQAGVAVMSKAISFPTTVPSPASSLVSSFLEKIKAWLGKTWSCIQVIVTYSLAQGRLWEFPDDCN